MRIVSILPINVERKNTIAKRISSFNRVNMREKTISEVTSISLSNNTIKKSRDCSNIISEIVPEKPRNLPKINSYLCIGLESIKNIVLPSTSLKRSWDHTKSTHTSPKNSIIARPKSTMIFESSQIVSFPSDIENNIKAKAKNIIKYKNLFLTISLNVLSVIFSIY